MFQLRKVHSDKKCIMQYLIKVPWKPPPSSNVLNNSSFLTLLELHNFLLPALLGLYQIKCKFLTNNFNDQNKTKTSSFVKIKMFETFLMPWF